MKTARNFTLCMNVNDQFNTKMWYVFSYQFIKNLAEQAKETDGIPIMAKIPTEMIRIAIVDQLPGDKTYYDKSYVEVYPDCFIVSIGDRYFSRQIDIIN